jgi:hypothetical protein
MPVLKVTAVGAALSAFAFWMAIFVQAAVIIGGILLLAFGGYVYYRIRKRRYAKQGIDLDARLALLHAHEAEEAGEAPAPAELSPA